MVDAWKVLVDAGLPDGPPRPPPRGPLDIAGVRSAVAHAVDSVDTARVAPLLAWLGAWRHHWGAHYARTFGADGPRFLARLAPRLDDPNRYLKLRRIAIANLAGMI